MNLLTRIPACRIGLLLTLASGLLWAPMARAQSETLAWGQKFGGPALTVSPGPVGQDETGESYGLFVSKSSSSTSISLRGFGIDGSPVFARTVLSVASNAEAKLLFVSKTINVTPYVVVGCRYQLASGNWNSFFAMYDSGGTIQWTHVYSSGTSSYPIGIDAPGDGYVYLAEIGDFPARHLQVEKLSMGGAVMGGHYNTKITPNPAYQAYHSGSSWIVTGSDPSSSSTSTMFGACDDTTAALRFSKSFFDHTEGTDTYRYNVSAYLYNGNVLAIENFDVLPTAGSHLYNHVFWEYSLSGVEQWHSQTLPGSALTPALVTGTGPSYVVRSNLDGNGGNIEGFSPNGTILWTFPEPAGWYVVRLAADTGGLLLSGYDAPLGTIQCHLQRYDTSGVQQSSLQFSNEDIKNLATDGSSVIAGAFGAGPNVRSTLLQRIILGFAESSVTSDVKSVKGGGSVHFTLHFNGPAPAAGTAKVHSSSPLLRFAGSQDYVLNYASGATSALFTGIAGTISAATPAQVTVILNGVKRAASITLSP